MCSSDSVDVSLSKLQEIVKDRGAWRAAVPGVTESRTGLSDSTPLCAGPVRDEAVSSTTLPFQAFSGTGLGLGE